MLPALFALPTLGEAALPILTGIGAFLGNIGETRDPLKALSAGALSAGGSLVGGRALGKLGELGVSRMANAAGNVPGLVTQGTGTAMRATDAFRNALPTAAIGLGQWGGGKVGEGVSNAVTGALPSTSQLFGVPGAIAGALKPGEKPYTGLYPQYSNQLPGMVSQYGAGPNVVDINNPLGQYQGQLAWQQMQNNQMLDYMQKYGEAGSAQAIKNKYADMPLQLAGARARANLLLQTTMMPNAQQNAANLANTGLQGIMQSAVQRGGYV
jgi:hypothetical protein